MKASYLGSTRQNLSLLQRIAFPIISRCFSFVDWKLYHKNQIFHLFFFSDLVFFSKKI